MDFKTAAKLGNYLAKDYAEGFFDLLVNYRDISASEAASRLTLHINTAQEFLEAMASLDIVDKREVSEGKRPYYRYALKTDRISIDIDLAAAKRSAAPEFETQKIREAKNAGARFVTARGGSTIGKIEIWTGKGRTRKERRVNLTAAQGLFLYHLPFPDGRPMSVGEIMTQAKIAPDYLPEIQDILELLRSNGVIETPPDDLKGD